MSDEFTDATEVLKNLFDRLMPEDTGGYTGLFSGWEEIVGPEMSMHVQLKDVINGSLVLAADHPGWIQKTRMIQAQILGKISNKYPELEIQRLKISVGDGSSKTVRSSIKKAEVQIVEKKGEDGRKTPSVASDEPLTEDDRKFYDLLEKMRHHGNS